MSGGHMMLQSCGPPLPIHRPGRFSFNLLSTFVDHCGGVPSCMKMCSFEFLSPANLRTNLVYRILRYNSPFTLFSKKKGPTISVKPIAAHSVIFWKIRRLLDCPMRFCRFFCGDTSKAKCMLKIMKLLVISKPQ